MDLKELKRLLDLMNRSLVQEMEIEEEGRRIRVRFREAEPRREVVSVPAANPAPAPLSPVGEPGFGPKEKSGRQVVAPEGATVFASPMVGTFYRAPAPGAEPFVKKGDRAKAGATLCIVEAMKVMNEIKAEQDVEVLDILVKNEEPVEFGQPLFILAAL